MVAKLEGLPPIRVIFATFVKTIDVLFWHFNIFYSEIYNSYFIWCGRLLPYESHKTLIVNFKTVMSVLLILAMCAYYRPEAAPKMVDSKILQVYNLKLHMSVKYWL